ncbi:peptidoglycan DD-metalloendopeptidase family protein [Photobacterium nomapromontoriensis]|uniref:peptidoglycan DD-metalloendopeptidase family protein n=1 Tax=Photobacterium nomapromontoriensis TaxID=2910237 RepID=UPI003D0D2B1B
MTSLILKWRAQYIAIPFTIVALSILAGIFFITHHHLTQKKVYKTANSLHPFQSDVSQTGESDVHSPKIITGLINYSFVISMINSGLTKNEIKSLLDLIENKIDIVRSVHKGDTYAIKTKVNRYNEKYISSFYYSGSSIDLFAMSGTNHNIYNEYGQTINKDPYYAFPLDKNFKISSAFNLQRKHPVTNLITPHLGTDFATPIGTTIHSIADGVVIKSKYNRFAGNYINIRHPNGSVSRYLHLSKRSVHVGDKVAKKQIIGFTGNSGRTTGPHLHLELLIKGVHVDYERYFKANASPSINTHMLLAAQIERAELINALHHRSMADI